MDDPNVDWMMQTKVHRMGRKSSTVFLLGTKGRAVHRLPALKRCTLLKGVIRNCQQSIANEGVKRLSVRLRSVPRKTISRVIPCSIVSVF